MIVETSRKHIIAGTVFTALLFLASLLTFQVSEDGYGFRNEFVNQYHCRIDAAPGIERGQKVRVCGLDAGRIDSTTVVEVDGIHEIEIRFSLRESFVVREDAIAKLESFSLVQELQLALDLGSPEAAPLPVGSEIKTIRRKQLGDTIVVLGDALDKMKDGGLGRMAVGDDNHKALDVILDTLVSDGGLGIWILGESRQKQLLPMTGDLRAAATNIRAGTENGSVLARLLGDNAMGKALDDIVSDVRVGARGIRRLGADLGAGRGVIGRLAKDEKLGENVKVALTGFAGAARDLHTSNAPVPLLVRDAEMGEHGRRAVANIATFSDSLASGEGLLASMIRSPEMYDEAIRVLREAREAIEDTRESYPISTITGVVEDGAPTVLLDLVK